MTFSRLFYVGLCCLCLVCGYYLYDKEAEQDIQVTPDVEKPLLSGRQVNSSTFNQKGLRSYRIEAQALEHYSTSGNTIFTQPILFIYKDGLDVEWRLSAENATLDKKQVLWLTGNVRMQNQLPNSILKEFQTESLRLDLVSKDFDTDDQITIIGDNFTNQGVGLKGNMTRRAATILNDIKGRYETLQN